MTDIDFKALVNKERKANKNKWYEVVAEIEEYTISLKAYNTTIQLWTLHKGAKLIVSDSGVYDCNVAKFNEQLDAILNNYKLSLLISKSPSVIMTN
jgi:hypothetical protein